MPSPKEPSQANHLFLSLSRLDYRPLEGFVYAISPFNFTALGGSLVSGPALMGNVVLWKPSQYNIYPSTLIYNILLEAGLPPDVIQFVPGDAQEVTDVALAHRDFAGLNFIGSSDVFRQIYGKIGQGIAAKTYREFPRVVGETSGKNFHLVHSSADISSVVNHTIRGAFEYQGQKCSATSRAYVPESRAKEFIEGLKAKTAEITMGTPDGDMSAFMGPVIHKHSFEKIKGIIDASNKDPSVKLIAGGTYDGSKGYFVQPTIYQVDKPDHNLFNQEIFGPVLAVHVYPDAQWESILKQVDQAGGGLALTGAVFANNRAAIRQAEDALRYSAGNFYISKSLSTNPVGRVARKLTCFSYRLQDHRRPHRPAVLRWRPIQRYQRQGRQLRRLATLHQPEVDQGGVLPSDQLHLPQQ